MRWYSPMPAGAIAPRDRVLGADQKSSVVAVVIRHPGEDAVEVMFVRDMNVTREWLPIEQDLMVQMGENY